MKGRHNGLPRWKRPETGEIAALLQTAHRLDSWLRAIGGEQLQQARPRFIITSPNQPWVSGLDTTREFPELEAFIATGYFRVAEGNG
ncbi:MAG: hypothetical protein ACP5OO_06925 [Chloroflexia bacterium]